MYTQAQKINRGRLVKVPVVCYCDCDCETFTTFQSLTTPLQIQDTDTRLQLLCGRGRLVWILNIEWNLRAKGVKTRVVRDQHTKDSKIRAWVNISSNKFFRDVLGIWDEMKGRALIYVPLSSRRALNGLIKKSGRRSPAFLGRDSISGSGSLTCT